MALRDVLKKAQYRPLSDSEARAALDADVALPFNHELWSYFGVRDVFGVEVAEGLGEAMRVGGQGIAADAYQNTIEGKIDLSLDATQATLAAIGAAIPALAPACDALKAIGRPTSKAFLLEGLPGLPSLNQIAAARATIASEYLSTAFAAAYNATALKIEAGEVLTAQSAVDSFASELGL